MITLSNYEEYFVLYVDNELAAPGKAAVEAFVAQHPQLAGELDALLNTRLPLPAISFAGKEELFSPVMKANSVDEALLLYLDDELPAAEKEAVKARLAADADYALQHSLLAQTKLNANEIVSHPHKKELYRHEKRAEPFAFWMRLAAAVVLLLIGTWFFFLNKGDRPGEPIVSNQPPAKMNSVINDGPAIAKQVTKAASPKEEIALTKKTTVTPLKKESQAATPKVQHYLREKASFNGNSLAGNRRNVIRLEAADFITKPNTVEPVTVNETITHRSVTSKPDASYNEQNSPINNPEVAWAEEKKTPARGFFRTVSRFIERKAGIGTVNADNELLIGVVAVKLK